MKIKHAGKDVEMKYSFNSFRYMEELDPKALQTLDSAPFKIVGIVETLLRGALNHNPNKKFSNDDVVEIIEEVMKESRLLELLEFLLDELQKSSFFKNLQEQQPKGSKTKSKK